MKEKTTGVGPPEFAGLLYIKGGKVRGMPIVRAWRDGDGGVWLATQRLEDGSYFGCKVKLYVRKAAYSDGAFGEAERGIDLVLWPGLWLDSNIGRWMGRETVRWARGSRGGRAGRNKPVVLIKGGRFNGKRLLGLWRVMETDRFFLGDRRGKKKIYGHTIEFEESWGPFGLVGFDIWHPKWEVEPRSVRFETNFLQ